MQYRHLGKAGIKVSELSIGSWVTYGKQVDVRAARDILQTAWEAGVNFFDNAEAYAGGQSEIIMGKALKELAFPREQYLISTKIFWGGKGPNDTGLNYKHIIEGVNNALKRLGLEYVDFVFAHRPDPETPMEEVVWGFNQIIQQGKAFYWGTSEWSAAQIMQAYHVAKEYHLRPPSMEQVQYNLLHRRRFEKEYAVLYKELGYGTTVWSPLAGGLLTGKYNDGKIPEHSRATLSGWEWVKDDVLDPEKLKVTRKLAEIAADLGVSMAQMSLAWLLKNPNVSTVITGASRVEQVRENMKAADVVPLLTDEVMARIEAALEGYREE
ncbi:MAG: aldo/keto reductase [Anaerolineaceae bacterium]